MSRTRQFIAVICIAAFVATGCNSNKVKEETIEVKPLSGLDRAKTVLENYANGAPIASEATSFPGIVEEVRKTDPAKADVLEKGFVELQKVKGGQLSAKAKELLKNL